MDGFDSVFKGQTDSETEFDTMFDREEDGELIDLVAGLHEDVEGVDPELHQTDRDSTPDDLKKELGEDHDTDNAPSGAEGSDEDPIIDLAMGECGASDTGVPGKTDADDFYANTNAPGIDPGEGPKQNPNPEDTDGEFDKIDEGFDGAQNFLDEGGCSNSCKEGEGSAEGADSGNMTMDDLEDGEDSSVKESYDGYEEGDSDLVDVVSGQ